MTVQSKPLAMGERYKNIFGRDMPAYQAEMLPQLEDDSLKEFVLLAPSGCAKTTLICFLAADMLGRNPNEHIFVVSSSMAQSVRLLQFIEDIMSSPEYKAIYGDLILSPEEAIWQTSTRKYFRREQESPHPSLLALGVGSAIVGNRATGILVDCIVTQHNSITAIQRTYLADWYFQLLMRRRDRHSRVVVIGDARFHAQDLYGQLLDRIPYAVYEATPEAPF